MRARKEAARKIREQVKKDGIGRMELAVMSELSKPRCQKVLNGGNYKIDDIESVLNALGFKLEIVATKLSFKTSSALADYKREIIELNMKYRGKP